MQIKLFAEQENGIKTRFLFPFLLMQNFSDTIRMHINKLHKKVQQMKHSHISNGIITSLMQVLKIFKLFLYKPV